MLADVSGKGVAAALLMANLQACFRSQSQDALRQPASMLKAVNKLFCESTPPEHYATLFFGNYDDRSRRLRYVNCGHPAAILLRANGTVERLQPTATVLGVFTNWSSEEGTVDLAPGDTLVLFSDGVTEAGVETEAEFGEDGLLRIIQANQAANRRSVGSCHHHRGCRGERGRRHSSGDPFLPVRGATMVLLATRRGADTRVCCIGTRVDVPQKTPRRVSAQQARVPAATSTSSAE